MDASPCSYALRILFLLSSRFSSICSSALASSASASLSWSSSVDIISSSRFISERVAFICSSMRLFFCSSSSFFSEIILSSFSSSSFFLAISFSSFCIDETESAADASTLLRIIPDSSESTIRNTITSAITEHTLFIFIKNTYTFRYLRIESALPNIPTARPITPKISKRLPNAARNGTIQSARKESCEMAGTSAYTYTHH